MGRHLLNITPKALPLYCLCCRSYVHRLFPSGLYITQSVKTSSPACLHYSSFRAQCLTCSRHSIVVTGEFSALLDCASRVFNVHCSNTQKKNCLPSPSSSVNCSTQIPRHLIGIFILKRILFIFNTPGD